MKFKALSTKPSQELEILLKEWREKLCDLRFRVASKKIKKVRRIRKTKKDIARALTLLNQAEASRR